MKPEAHLLSSQPTCGGMMWWKWRLGPAGSWLQLLPLPLPNCGGLNISHAWGPHFSVYHMAVSYCISACSRIFKGPPQAKGGMRSNQVGNDHSVHSPSLCSHILDFNVLCSAKKKKKAYIWVCVWEYVLCTQLLSCVWHFGTPWTVAHQAPLSMRDRTGVSCIAGGFFTSWATWEAPVWPYQQSF